MKSTNRHDVRLSSKHCSTCKDLRRLSARIEAALGDARNFYTAAVKSTDSPALRNSEEEVKQTSAARKLILLRDSDSSDRSALPDAGCPPGGVTVRERNMK